MSSAHPPHTHTCPDCHRPWRCYQECEPNYDGWPEAVCPLERLGADMRCEACIEKEGQAFIAALTAEEREL